MSIAFFILAIICYSIKELHAHGKLMWTPIGFNSSFWGNTSYLRKYKFIDKKIVDAPNNFYYRFFKIAHKERWPTSATLTVVFTDGAHLMQTLLKLFLIASLVSYSPIFIYWIDGGIYFVVWGATFTLTYKLLSK